MSDLRFSRTARLIGEDAVSILRASHVMLLGLGGVGGHAFDALVRAGVGKLTIIDGDAFAMSNLNRQMLADLTTVGRRKVAVAKEHAARLVPETEIVSRDMFLTEENIAHIVENHPCDVILDAIDTVGVKVRLVAAAQKKGVPLLTCMSTGNRLDPSRLQISDLANTHTCPISRIMRRELAKCDIRHATVLWSDEPTITPVPEEGKRQVPASAPFVPGSAGIMMAQWAVSTILDMKGFHE